MITSEERRCTQSKFKRIWGLPRFTLFAACILLSGCAHLPDVQPFTDATVELRSAVASGGAAVVSELRRVEIQGVRKPTSDLEKAWEDRNRAMNALVEYANSLQGIVDAGNSGSESIGKLAASVQRLASAANIVQPGTGEAGALITETAQFVYDAIAKARAAASLEKALAEVQPAVERIAATMSEDMQAIDDLVRLASTAQRDALTIKNQGEISYRDQLLATRLKLMDQLGVNLKNGKKPSELNEADELVRVDALISHTKSWHEPYEKGLATIADRERLSRQLITEAKSGFADWAAAHARMLTALRTKHIPSAAELVQAAERIRGLVERFQKL